MADPTITELLEFAVQHNASDIHLVAGTPPTVRIDAKLKPLDFAPLTAELVNSLVLSFTGQGIVDRMNQSRKEQDFSISYGENRFRCNSYFEGGSMAACLRLLPRHIPELSTLGAPEIVRELLSSNQGLFIVAGPTGHGKSTTMASIVSYLLTQKQVHVITIEDPIEYILEHKQGIVSQREVGQDTPSFSSGLRAALREDPDVVLVGEMRDQETIEATLQLAQTGHLVLSTLHTNSAAQTANRIIDTFPPAQQQQIRVSLSETLLGILSQRLLPKIQGGRVLVAELLIANPAVRAVIRDDKTHQLTNMIQTSAAEGMVALDKELARFVTSGIISIDEALSWAQDPKALKMMIY